MGTYNGWQMRMSSNRKKIIFEPKIRGRCMSGDDFMKIFAVCGTVFQLLIALQLRFEEYSEDEFSVVLVSPNKQMCDIVTRLKTSYLVKQCFLWTRAPRFGLKSRIEKIKESIFIGKRDSSEFPVQIECDLLLLGNSFAENEEIYARVINKKNVRVRLLEDGTINYTKHFSQQWMKPERILKCIKRELLHPIYRRVEGLYLFHPELADENLQMKTFPIPNFLSIKGKKLQEINRIFGYDKSVDQYKERFIFFEESYFADGKNIDDVSIIEKVAQIVGKDNIIIKIHPRNPINRFANLGYKTSINNQVPWELITLNQSIYGKCLLSISSGTVINSWLLTDAEYTGILLLHCFPEIYQNADIAYKSIYDACAKICAANSKRLKMPSDMKEFESLIYFETKTNNI